jgi:hypothetical protein
LVREGILFLTHNRGSREEEEACARFGSGTTDSGLPQSSADALHRQIGNSHGKCKLLRENELTSIEGPAHGHARHGIGRIARVCDAQMDGTVHTPKRNWNW